MARIGFIGLGNMGLPMASKGRAFGNAINTNNIKAPNQGSPLRLES
jgi:3-hydroxyisobutyrate dehydrogenase-like beta-hydroxyacid dehydrogenase